MVNGGTYSYEYHLKDHLGNTRVTYSDANNNGSIEGDEILQVTDYYPFGMRHEIEGYPNHANQKYLYNGKELQEETGWYDYGARMYDPTLGRWHVMDPKAEKFHSWSPFNYCYNNPIRYIDRFGLEGEERNEEEEEEEEVDPWKTAWELVSKVLENGNEFTYDNGKVNVTFKQGEVIDNNQVAQSGGGAGESGVFTTAGMIAGLYEDYNKLMYADELAHNVDQLLPYHMDINTGKVTWVNPKYLKHANIGKGVSTGASVVTTGMAYNEILNGNPQPITYADAGVGTLGLSASIASYFTGAQIPYVGGFVAIYGAARLGWDIGWNLGVKYGPTNWYGTDDDRYFK